MAVAPAHIHTFPLLRLTCQLLLLLTVHPPEKRLQGIECRDQKSNCLHLSSGKMWDACGRVPACRMSEVGEAWLLLASCCDDKNARSLSHFVHRAGTAIFTEISRFHGPASAEKLALSVAIPCCPPCPCLWRSFRREHLRACCFMCMQ